MSAKLAEILGKIRGVKGAKLRDVENATGVSNAYLSQLENDPKMNPSPHILHKLAEYYSVPYESLMEHAGYLDRGANTGPAKNQTEESRRRKKLGALEAALMSAKLTDEEQEKVAEFIEFLRAQRRREGK